MTNAVNNIQSPLIEKSDLFSKSAPSQGGSSAFAETFGKFISEVNQLQQDATDATQKLATGQGDDLGVVVSAVEKSELAFKTLMSIRTKLLDAYEELKNMPI